MILQKGLANLQPHSTFFLDFIYSWCNLKCHCVNTAKILGNLQNLSTFTF
jgi:hypothetical protein